MATTPKKRKTQNPGAHQTWQAPDLGVIKHAVGAGNVSYSPPAAVAPLQPDLGASPFGFDAPAPPQLASASVPPPSLAGYPALNQIQGAGPFTGPLQPPTSDPFTGQMAAAPTMNQSINVPFDSESFGYGAGNVSYSPPPVVAPSIPLATDRADPVMPTSPVPMVSNNPFETQAANWQGRLESGRPMYSPERQGLGRPESAVNAFQQTANTFTPKTPFNPAVGPTVANAEQAHRDAYATRAFDTGIQQGTQDFANAQQTGAPSPGISPEMARDIYVNEGQMNALRGQQEAFRPGVSGVDAGGTQFGMRPGEANSALFSGATEAGAGNVRVGPQVGTEGQLPYNSPERAADQAEFFGKQDAADQARYGGTAGLSREAISAKADEALAAVRARTAADPVRSAATGDPNMYNKATGEGRVVNTAWGTQMDARTGLPLSDTSATGRAKSAEVSQSRRQKLHDGKRADQITAAGIRNGTLPPWAMKQAQAERNGEEISDATWMSWTGQDRAGESRARQHEMDLARHNGLVQVAGAQAAMGAVDPELLKAIQSPLSGAPVAAPTRDANGNVPLSPEQQAQKDELAGSQDQAAATQVHATANTLADIESDARVPADAAKEIKAAIENGDPGRASGILKQYVGDEAYGYMQDLTGNKRYAPGNPTGSMVLDWMTGLGSGMTINTPDGSEPIVF